MHDAMYTVAGDDMSGNMTETIGDDSTDTTMESAPSEGERPWTSLPASVKRVWLLRSAIRDCSGALGCGIVALISHLAGWWTFWHGPVLIVVAVMLTADLATQPLRIRYAYAFNRYSIGSHDVMLHKGWLLRTTTTIPYNRIQHVTTKQGPLLRSFSLTAVELHTAVDEHEIAALDDDCATSIVNQISMRVLTSKDDV